MNILIIEKIDNQIKASLLNQNGKLYADKTKDIKRYYNKLYGYYFDPHEFIYSCRAVINDLILSLPKINKISSIGIVGDMDAFLFCDLNKGSVLSPAFLLDDAKTNKLFLSLKKTSLSKEYKNISQMNLSQSSLFMNLKWFIDDGSKHFSFDLNKCVCMSLETYLLYSLSGIKVFQSDYISMSLSGLLDFEKKQYSRILLNELGIMEQCFPELIHPFKFDVKTKGFVPLEDGVSIKLMVYKPSLNWLCHQDIDFGSVNIHISNQKILYEKFVGLETVDLDCFISRSLVINRNEISKCVKDEIKIPDLISQFSSLTFSDILNSNVSLGNENQWFILSLNKNTDSHEFALINNGVDLNKIDFSVMFMEGVFYALKMKLQTLDNSFEQSGSSIYCTTSLPVDHSIFQLMANIIQSSVTVINTENIIKLMVQFYFLFYMNNEKSFPKIKKDIYNIVVPDQDPISNYVKYNSWLSYYNKLFGN